MTLDDQIRSLVAEAMTEGLRAAAEKLSKNPGERWLSPEAAREYLDLTKRQWERYSPHLPRRYLSERVVRYPVGRLDEALEAAVSAERSVVGSDDKNDDKNDGAGGGPTGAGGEASLRRALGSR